MSSSVIGHLDRLVAPRAHHLMPRDAVGFLGDQDLRVELGAADQEPRGLAGLDGLLLGDELQILVVAVVLVGALLSARHPEVTVVGDGAAPDCGAGAHAVVAWRLRARGTVHEARPSASVVTVRCGHLPGAALVVPARVGGTGQHGDADRRGRLRHTGVAHGTHRERDGAARARDVRVDATRRRGRRRGGVGQGGAGHFAVAGVGDPRLDAQAVVAAVVVDRSRHLDRGGAVGIQPRLAFDDLIVAVPIATAVSSSVVAPAQGRVVGLLVRDVGDLRVGDRLAEVVAGVDGGRDAAALHDEPLGRASRAPRTRACDTPAPRTRRWRCPRRAGRRWSSRRARRRRPAARRRRCRRTHRPSCAGGKSPCR